MQGSEEGDRYRYWGHKWTQLTRGQGGCISTVKDVLSLFRGERVRKGFLEKGAFELVLGG